MSLKPEITEKGREYRVNHRNKISQNNKKQGT